MALDFILTPSVVDVLWHYAKVFVLFFYADVFGTLLLVYFETNSDWK